MMFEKFAQIEKLILEKKIKKTIALAGSQNADALASVVDAHRKGVADAILIGDIEHTHALLRELDESPDGYTFIKEPDSVAAANIACQLVADGKADFPMKGKVSTADFIRAVLDKTRGFVPKGGLISQTTIVENTQTHRMMLITDCAINIAPDYAAKVKIMQNAVALAHLLGIECPKVAAVAPIETINPAMQSTVDAAMLAKASERGQFKGCVVDGPLGLDNAINLEAAHMKDITNSPVAGFADILLMPELTPANFVHKVFHYYTDMHVVGVVCGTKVPVVMTSRTDEAICKYYAILVCILQLLANA